MSIEICSLHTLIQILCTPLIGWCSSNRLDQITPALYEFNNILCGLLVPITTGLSLLVFGLQINLTNISPSKGLSILGIYGSN